MIADKPITAVTIEDINERFASGSWTSAGGNWQSAAFAFKAILHLQEFQPATVKQLSQVGVSIVDYGCAEGDGTAVLAGLFVGADVSGRDVSDAAIARASARWPLIKFSVDDIRTPTITYADCIWTSHTLEHFADPQDIISTLRHHCARLIVLVPPIEKETHRNNASHVDAPFTEDWLRQIDCPMYKGRFSIPRRDTHDRNTIWLEESLILIWDGV